MTKANAGEVAPRAVEPEAGHADHDEVGPDRRAATRSRGPSCVEHPRRVVLDDDVAGRRRSACTSSTPRGSAKSIVRLFLFVLSAEKIGPRSQYCGLGLRHAADEADAVGPLRRLEVDHLGAEQREHVADERAGPERRHVEDPQPLERQLNRRCLTAGASRRPRRRAGRGVGGVLAERAAPARRGGSAADDSRYGGPGLRDPVARVGDERRRAREVVDRRARSRRRRSARSGCGTRRRGRVTSATVCSATHASIVGASAVRSRK